MGSTQHTLYVREFQESSSVQLRPPRTLPWSSTWYNPFKRLHVISVCAGSSQRAAAHSTFSSAGALTFPSACWASSLFPPLSFFLSLHPLYFSRAHLTPVSPLPRTLSPSRTHAFSDGVALGHSDVPLFAVTGRLQRTTAEGPAFFLFLGLFYVQSKLWEKKHRWRRKRRGG